MVETVQVMGEQETDQRVVDYVKATRANDINTLIEMRLLYSDDQALTRRFKTVEAVYKGLLEVYAREIQILRLEVSGWQAICDGQDNLAEEGLAENEQRAAKQCITRGLEKVERALAFRKIQPDIGSFEKLSRTP